MFHTNPQTTYAKNRLTRVCGLLSLLIMGVWQTASAQLGQMDAICPADNIITPIPPTTAPLAVAMSSLGFVTQSPLYLVGAFVALFILLFGVIKFRKNTTFLLTIGLLGFMLFTYNSTSTLDAQTEMEQGIHCVCHAEDVVTAPPLVGQTGEMQGITDHEQCRPEGLYKHESGLVPPFCKVYDTDGREVMTSARRVIGYFATWRTGKNGLPAFLVTDIPWGKLTHINYAFGHVAVDDNYALSVNTDVPGNAGTDMEWPEYGITMDSSLPYTGHFNLFAQQKEKHPHVKLLLSVGGWAETGGYWTSDETLDMAVDGVMNGFASDGGFYAMTTNADGSVNQAGIEAFADSSVDFLREFPFFDGIDIDYEYATSLMDTGNPTDFDYSNPRRPYLNESYDVLMRVLREKLDQAGVEDDRYYQLTVAAPASSYMLRGLEQYKPAIYLDFLNMMSYDLHGSWNAFVGHNAPLYDNGADPELDAWRVYDTSNLETAPYMAHGSLNTEWAANYFKGIIPPGRINVGIPYYTRGWQDVEGGTNGFGGLSYPKDGQMFDRSACPDGTGIGQNNDPTDYCGNGAMGIDNIWHDLGELGQELGSGASPMWHAKNLEMGNTSQFMMDIVAAHAETSMDDPIQQMIGTYERFYDEVAVAPWLWNAEKRVFLSTEDEQSFDTKVDWVIEEELGGIMFWEMSGDYSTPTDPALAERGICADNYFMGSTLTSRGFNDLQNASPYGVVVNDRPMPAEAIDAVVELHSYPLGDDNFPVNPQLRVEVPEGISLAGAIIEFDVPTSTPPSIKEYWGTGWQLGVEVIEEGHSGNGNVGGLAGDFHRVRVTLKQNDLGSTFDSGGEGLLFYLPFSTISAVTIDFGSGPLALHSEYPDIPLVDLAAATAGPAASAADCASAVAYSPDGPGPNAWDQYTAASGHVLYEGKLWKAKYATSDTPEESAWGSWELIGSCLP